MADYTQSPGDYIIAGAKSVTERGIGFAGACGEAAVAVVSGIMTGQPPTIQQVISIVKAGWPFGVAPNGTSNPDQLMQAAAATGTPLTRSAPGSVLTTIGDNLSRGLPTIVEVQNARAFGGWDSTVRGHYVTVVGKTSGGNFIVADANQPAALSGGFVQYSGQQILNAAPNAVFTPQGTPSVGGAVSGFTADAISQGLQGALRGIGGTIAGSLGATGLSDVLWRSALILGGMVLIVLGLLVFFSHQEETAVNIVSQQAGNAAKVAAVAA